MLARALLRREAGRIILLRSLRSRVRSARGEVEGELSEGDEGGAGTWRRSRIMGVFTRDRLEPSDKVLMIQSEMAAER